MTSERERAEEPAAKPEAPKCPKCGSDDPDYSPDGDSISACWCEDKFHEIEKPSVQGQSVDAIRDSLRPAVRAYLLEWSDNYRRHGDLANLHWDGSQMEYHLANFAARQSSKSVEGQPFMSAEEFDMSFEEAPPWGDLRTVDNIYAFAEAYTAARDEARQKIGNR